jgi:hypothetical protein
MPVVDLRWAVIGVCAVLIAGCGGGGSTNGGAGGGSSSTKITYSFGGTAPTAVAVKIGSGDFASATIAGGELSFTLPEGTIDFAVAYACPGFSPAPGLDLTQNFEYLNYSSSLDGTSYIGGCVSSPPTSALGGGTTPTATLTGNINSSSFPGASELFVWALAADSGYGQGFNLAQGDNFSMSFLPPGTYNVVTSLYDSSWNALAVKSLGGQTVPGAVNNGSPVDFGAGDATTSQPITYVNVPAGYPAPSTNVSVDSRQLSALLQMNGEFGFSTGNQALLTQYSMLPADIAQGGDEYQINSAAVEQLPSAISEVNALTILIGGGPATVTFPMPWPYAGPVPAALPTLNFSYAGSAGQSGLIYAGNLQWAPQSGTYDAVLISLTQNYQNAFPSVTIPDLNAISGFLAAPASGTTVSWSAEIHNPGPSGGTSGTSSAMASVSSDDTTSSSSNATTTWSVLNSGMYAVP